jgi:hypothetical protein
VPSATASCGPTVRPRRLRSSSNSFQDCALSRMPSATDEFLAFGGGADDHEQTLRLIFAPGLHVNAIDRDVSIPLARQVAIEPAGVFVGRTIPRRIEIE